MPNFIIKIFIAKFLTNFKVFELEHEFEPGDLGYCCTEEPKYCICCCIVLQIAAKVSQSFYSKLVFSRFLLILRGGFPMRFSPISSVY